MKQQNTDNIQNNNKLHAFSRNNVHQFQLSNGLQVILAEDNFVSEVFGMVVVKAGGKHDPQDATGVAHYQEHMLFKGTEQLGTINWEKEKVHIEKIRELYDELGKTTNKKERSKIQESINKESVKAAKYAIPNEMDTVVRKMGGRGLNAATSSDATYFYNSFPSNQLERWLELYSHRFMHPVFRAFQAELEVVYEEKNMYSDHWETILFEKFNTYLFKNHPYGQQPLIGTTEHLKNPSLTRMYEFFKTYYVANNMALILAGDFRKEQVIPLIESKFSLWPSGEIPALPYFEEPPFRGREAISKFMSPVPLGFMGFRTITENHPDYPVLEVAHGLLTNENMTGLFDQLSLDNKILAADISDYSFTDHGTNVISFVPLLFKQTLASAEKLVWKQLEQIKSGNFDDAMVDAVKNGLQRNFMLSLEDLSSRAFYMADYFVNGRPVEMLFDYPQELRSITKKAVVDVMNRYFHKNYLVFYSRMGWPRNKRIRKPNFKPLVSNTRSQSDFATHLEKLPAVAPLEKFIDFDTAVFQKDITERLHFYHVPNPQNDVFELTLKFGVGTHKFRKLGYAAELMNMAGTAKLPLNDLKNEFSRLGSSYIVHASQSYVTVSVEGIDNQLIPTLKLLNLLLNEPEIEQEKTRTIFETEKGIRKVERSEPSRILQALSAYLLYKQKSFFIDRFSLKEIKQFDVNEFVKLFLEATTYEAEIHYTGSLPPQTVIGALRNIRFRTPLKATESPVIHKKTEYTTPQVFFVNKRRSLQTKIMLFGNSSMYYNNLLPFLKVFNMYFGQGSSSLVNKTIRESHSMAYSAAAAVSSAYYEGYPMYFQGSMATQADKSMKAIEVFFDLLRNMPSQPEQIDVITSYLQQVSAMNYPHFRDLSFSVVSLRRQGFVRDPDIDLMRAYQTMTFDDIEQFYKQHVQQLPLVIGIVGDKNRLKIKDFKRFGELTQLSQKTLFA